MVVALATEAGLRVVTEGFVDRAYRPDGSLVPRREPGAVHDSPATCVAQALRIARLGTVATSDGSDVALAARSLCVHGDTPHAVATATVVRQALVDAGVAVRAFA